jgi:Metal-independent alpha-mannosidase (GH125)
VTKTADSNGVRLRWGLVLAFALGVLPASAAAPARANETAAVTTTLEKLYVTAYDESINRHAKLQPDGTTYVSSGDIDAEWLRDAAAVMEPYIALAGSDETIEQSLRGTVARMARYILIDPYANAYRADYSVAERKFEADSLLYPIWFADRYWQVTGDRSIFSAEANHAFERILRTLRVEQHHRSRSTYRHPDLPFDGQGRPVRFTGMIWSGFRPSDDPVRYNYNIPDNMFAVVTLRRLSAIERKVYHNERDAQEAWGLAVQIQHGIERFGKARLGRLGTIYAYEVDGRGHSNLDAVFRLRPARRRDLSAHAPFRALLAQSVLLHREVRERHRQRAHAQAVHLAAVARGRSLDLAGSGRNRARHGVHRGGRCGRPPLARVVQCRLARSVHARRLRVAQRALRRADPHAQR